MDSPREIWSSRIEECERGSESIASYCRRNNIKPSSYYVWRRKLHGNKVTKHFREVELGVADNFLGIELHVSEKLKLRLFKGYSLTDLKSLLNSR